MKREILETAPPIIKDFLTYSESIRGKSSLSVSEYFIDLRTFFRYIKQVRGLVPSSLPFDEIDILDVDLELIKSVTLSDLFAFSVYCKDERDNKASTRARKTSTIRIFFSYLTTQARLIEVNPADRFEMPKSKPSLPKFLTLDESVNLLNSVDGANKERDYCIITLFLNCGMRLSELCNIKLSDIKEDSLKLLGKGNKERVVYLNDACISAINDYLKVRPVDNIKPQYKNYLFISRIGNKISPKTVQHLINVYLEKAGLADQGLSTHKLRHTAATLMYQHGDVDIRVLKDILGHSNLGTTQIYTHVSDQQAKAAIAANPLAKVNKTKKENEKN